MTCDFVRGYVPEGDFQEYLDELGKRIEETFDCVNKDIAAICPCPPVLASQTEFEDALDAINTGAAKVQGYCVYDTTSLRPIWADGDTDVSPWRDAQGVIVYTPV